VVCAGRAHPPFVAAAPPSLQHGVRLVGTRLERDRGDRSCARGQGVPGCVPGPVPSPMHRHRSTETGGRVGSARPPAPPPFLHRAGSVGGRRGSVPDQVDLAPVFWRALGTVSLQSDNTTTDPRHQRPSPHPSPRAQRRVPRRSRCPPGRPNARARHNRSQAPASIPPPVTQSAAMGPPAKPLPAGQKIGPNYRDRPAGRCAPPDWASLTALHEKTLHGTAWETSPACRARTLPSSRAG
jgi:hypothetical protein